MAGRKRSGRGVGSAASSREVNQGQGTALAQLLTDHAVDLDVAQDHVRWIKKRDELPEELRATWGKYVPTVVTRWQSNGHAVDQVRIPEDKRTDDGVKYLFPDKTEPPLNCVRDPGHGPILLVEGTFQHLAAGSYAPAEFAIYGMFGCWGWSGRDLSFVAGRELYLVLDADRARNSDVWDAAKGLKERAEVMGAAKALLVTVPGKAKDGLDDFLATVAEDQRDVVLRRLLDKATPNLGRRPPQKNRKSDRSRWFDENGNLKAEDAAKAVYAKCPMRLTLDKRVAVYRDGVYRPDDEVLMGVVLQLLKNDYKPQHFTTIKQAISGTLALQNKRLPERLDRPWVNVLNGWVDLETGNLIDHDPRLATSVQLPITYDPDATCPTFDAWLQEVAGDQAQALLEDSSEMLDLSSTPQWALLLYGPSRSGKSTYLRLLEAIAGKENRSAVSLHALSEDRFAAARPYGKILNISADLSAGHIEDINIFKQLTGEDPIDANPKYGKPFTYTNVALFGFSANEIPSVGESSRAYSERIRVYQFGSSFAGHVDKTLEPKMREELPGIFNRLVKAWQTRQARGHDLEQDQAVREEFERSSDRVQMWLDEEMEIVHEHGGKPVTDRGQLPADRCSTPTALTEMFNIWAIENHMAGLGRKNLMSRLISREGIVYVRRGRDRAKALNLVERGDAGGLEPDPPSKPPAVSSQVNGPVSDSRAVTGGLDPLLSSTSTSNGSSDEASVLDKGGPKPPGTARNRPEPPLTSENGRAVSDPEPPAKPPGPEHPCPKCGGVTLVNKKGVRACVAPGRCNWKEYLAKELDGSGGLFEGASSP